MTNHHDFIAVAVAPAFSLSTRYASARSTRSDTFNLRDGAVQPMTRQAPERRNCIFGPADHTPLQPLRHLIYACVQDVAAGIRRARARGMHPTHSGFHAPIPHHFCRRSSTLPSFRFKPFRPHCTYPILSLPTHSAIPYHFPLIPFQSPPYLSVSRRPRSITVVYITRTCYIWFFCFSAFF